MNHTEIVKHVYDRFANEDAAAILATFAPDIEFRLAQGHPYQPSGEPWIGGDAIVKNFFMRAAGEWERWSVVIHEIHDMGDTVVVEGRYTGKYKPTGKALDVQVCHVWKFRGDKIGCFHQYLDSARLQDTMGHLARANPAA
ncbi:MAG: nuclear transport factor 2 family protein [Acidobacteria bacterium]|nr:nuclear transport factor 2 family protein [Acidobacteriota bacterium]